MIVGTLSEHWGLQPKRRATIEAVLGMVGALSFLEPIATQISVQRTLKIVVPNAAPIAAQISGAAPPVKGAKGSPKNKPTRAPVIAPVVLPPAAPPNAYLFLKEKGFLVCFC